MALSDDLQLSIKLTRDMQKKLDSIRDVGETHVSVVTRLIKEHLIAEKQREMVPFGTSESLRVTPRTRDRILKMARTGDKYDDTLARLIDERRWYRKVAAEIAEEGRRVQFNHDATVHNFKVIIRGLVGIDLIPKDDLDMFHTGVDDLVDERMDADPDRSDA